MYKKIIEAAVEYALSFDSKKQEIRLAFKAGAYAMLQLILEELRSVDARVLHIPETQGIMDPAIQAIRTTCVADWLNERMK